ncbi:hypothetical protein AV521_45795 [Streptomyces sp. IMTB 2501]|uniref:hypothetical protein n=1 Tax=Streptomyces sp. IMTB 2501 TaxID=1776340 RepID=UPI00096BD8B4|nr:hypothetical protein [Streptomyces sp. IMTB 2501]OLZ59243.1 hypothetical protein AV521_45795 [Streptomyces sp. IMTB 2501]
MSTEDHQDPDASPAWQWLRAKALVSGHGRIVAEFFDTGRSRTIPWAGWPRAAALLAATADPDREFDAVVTCSGERAFYSNQFAAMAPPFDHYGVEVWGPELLANPRYTGRQVWNRRRTDHDLVDPANTPSATATSCAGTLPATGSSPPAPRTRRWCNEADFITVQNPRICRETVPGRTYLPAGLLCRGVCGRRRSPTRSTTVPATGAATATP